MTWYYNFSRPEFDDYELIYYIAYDEYKVV